MRYIFSYFIVLTIMLVSNPVKADLDFLMSLKTDDTVANTLNLETKHISDQEMEEFTSELLANIFNIEGGTIEVVLDQQAHHFDQNGFGNLQNFIKKNQLDILNIDHYTTISTILTTQPVITNQQPSDGSYRWLVETAILMSLHNNNIEAAKFNEAQKNKILDDLSLNKKEYTVQIQIRRDPTATNDHKTFVEYFIIEEN